jgi:hypothetical protein
MTQQDRDLPLTPLAKAAIRNYMLTIVAIPTFLLTVLSAAAGFIFAKSQEVVYQTALLDAKTKALNEITDLQRTISALAADSQATRTLMKRDQDDIAATMSSIKLTFDSLQGVKDIAALTHQVDKTLAESTSFQGAVAKQVKTDIFTSELINSAGDCSTPTKKVLGSHPQLKFCALSMSQTYRHGVSKGGISCQVTFEQNQWALIATGATHECGNTGGATSIQCQAVCWQ